MSITDQTRRRPDVIHYQEPDDQPSGQTAAQAEARPTVAARLRNLFKPASEQALAVVDRPQPAAQPSTLTMIARAEAEGIDVERLAKLWELHERMLAQQARQAFYAALAAFKASDAWLGLERSRLVKYGETEYRHQDLGVSLPAFNRALAPFGLSLTFSTTPPEGETPPGKVWLAVILGHSMGHSVSSGWWFPEDHSGSKNNIQAIGSTWTYAERYLANLITGNAAAHDDDGRGGPITPEEANELRQMLHAAGKDEAWFCRMAKIPGGIRSMSRQQLHGFGGLLREKMKAQKRADVEAAARGPEPTEEHHGQ